MQTAHREGEETRGDFSDAYAHDRGDLYRALAVILRDRDVATDAVDEGFSRALPKWNKTEEALRLPLVLREGYGWGLARTGRSDRVRGFRLERPLTDPEKTALRVFESLEPEERAVIGASLLLGWDADRVAASLPHLDPAQVEPMVLGASERLAASGVSLRELLRRDADGLSEPLPRLASVKGRARLRRLRGVGLAAAAVAIVTVVGIAGYSAFKDEPAVEAARPTAVNAATGIEWEQAALPIQSGEIQAMAATADGFVAVGQTYDGSNRSFALQSPDGFEWTDFEPVPTVSGGYVQGFTSVGDGLLAIGSGFDDLTGRDRPTAWSRSGDEGWVQESLPAANPIEVRGIEVPVYAWIQSVSVSGDRAIAIGIENIDVGDPRQLFDGAKLEELGVNTDFGWETTQDGVTFYTPDGGPGVTVGFEELGIDADLARLVRGRPIAWTRDKSGKWERSVIDASFGPDSWVNQAAANSTGIILVVGGRIGTDTWFSADGTDWVQVGVDPAFTPSGAAAIGGAFVLFGQRGGTGTVLASSDGVTFTDIEDPDLQRGIIERMWSAPTGLVGLIQIADGSGNFLGGFGSEGGGIVTTIADLGGGFAPVGPGYGLAISKDGLEWNLFDLSGSTGFGFYPNQIALGEDRVLVTGWSEVAIDSFDGAGPSPTVFVGTFR